MKQNKSKDIHIMMDVETTSNNQFDTMLLQIAMIAFDYETGEYLDTFNAIIDTDIYPKMTFNTGTLKFWLEMQMYFLIYLLKMRSLKQCMYQNQQWYVMQLHGSLH